MRAGRSGISKLLDRFFEDFRYYNQQFSVDLQLARYEQQSNERSLRLKLNVFPFCGVEIVEIEANIILLFKQQKRTITRTVHIEFSNQTV